MGPSNISVWSLVLVVLSLCQYVSASPGSQITPAPPAFTTSKILRRQANNLIGYFGGNGNYQASTCAGAIFSISGAYGLCCPGAGQCQQVTACVGNTAIAYNGAAGTQACPAAQPACVVDIVLASSGAAGAVSWIGCDVANRAPLTFYQANPAAAATTPTPTAPPANTPTPTPGASNPAVNTTPQSTPPAGTPGLVTVTLPAAGTSTISKSSGGSVSSGKGQVAAPLTTIPISTQTISGSSVIVVYSVASVTNAESSGSSTSVPTSGGKKFKTWMIGAIVGPIVGLLIIAALVAYILYLRRKHKHAPPSELPPATATATATEATYYTAPKPGFHEVSATQSPMVGYAELSGNNSVPYQPNAANTGQTYAHYPQPIQQYAPVEMDASKRY